MLNFLRYFYTIASLVFLYLGDVLLITAIDQQQFTNKLYEAVGKDYALDSLRNGDSEYLLWHLENPIRFYSDIYNYLYINTNGLLTFNSEFPDYINQPFPLECPAVAPFYANVDTTNSNSSNPNSSTTSITIFTSQNPEQLQYVSELVHYAFDNHTEFEADELVVATWKNVGYYDRKTDKLNTFQVALILGDAESYVQFIYPNDGLNWLQGENGPLGLPDIRAQAGFISEDGRFFNLIGSGANSVRFLSEKSNVNIPGVWLYRVGIIDSYEDNVEEPTHFHSASDESLNWKTCSNVGYRTCHQNAKCIDRVDSGKGGFCCNCQTGFYGNGEICIKNDIPIRVIGSLMGELNGIFINERSKLQSYIVTADGRTYTAITPIDKELGAHLRLALPIITAIGWLFAKPLRHHLNGYQLSGGELLHSTKLTYDSGEILWINQTFEGLNFWDQLSMKVDLFGRVPHIPHNLKLHMAEFIEEYEFVLPNELYAKQMHSIEIPEENRVVSFQMEQSIYFDPCMESEQKQQLQGSKYFHKISKIMLDYFEKDEALRSSVLTTVGVHPTSNACTDGTANCGANMVCIPYEDTYRCDCMFGYTTEVTTADVEICVDIDECAIGSDTCDENSVCVNTEGGFSCHCEDGFEGNGYRCFAQNTVADSIVKYSTIATTIADSDSQTPSIDVEFPLDTDQNHHFQDNFTQIYENHESYYDRIDDCHKCSTHANCWKGHCICRSGYSGDGIQCYSNCADDEVWEVSMARCVKFGYDDTITVEAHCDYWGQCTCDEGYELTENGAMCRLLMVDTTAVDENKFEDFVPCDVEFNCHSNATCDWYESDLHFRCTCNPGFSGDGYQCEYHETDESSCSTKPEICHKYAICAINELFGTWECQCQIGYTGDGYHCDIAPVCLQNDDCGVNAFCDSGACQCNSGYERNAEAVCVVNDSCGTIQHCGTHAICKHDRIADVKYCSCLEGYEGDALTTCHPIKRLQPCNVQFNCDVHATCEPTEDPAVYECQCGTGYNGDGYICIEDQNCLNTPQLCDMNAQCLSTNNGLVCVCNKGFYGNGSLCLERKQYEAGFLIVSQGVVIVRVPLNGKNVRPISVASMAIGLDNDCIEGRIYWGDISTKKIISSKYDGSDIKTFIGDDIESPEGIAIDSISRRLYWTDSVKDTIEVASLDKASLRTVLINKNLVNPRGIAVDPYREKLYWSDWNRDSPKIEMSDLDGTGRMVLLSKDSVILPNSLVVLERTGELCYADAGAKKVECVDGYNKRTRIISNDLTYPFGLVYTHEQFFWTDWITKKLESVDTFGQRQKSLQIPLFGSHKMYAIAAIEDECPQIDSPCQLNNGGCTDARLCLVNRKAPSGKSCKCTLQSKLCAAPNSIV